MRGFGKIILFGEHSVVYGYPALAAGLTVGIQCEIGEKRAKSFALSAPLWNLEATEGEDSPVGKALSIISENIPHPKGYSHLILTPEIPCRAGLGSSAAMAVSIIKTLVDYNAISWPLEKMNALAWEVERVFHGTPSGIDNTVASYGGLCYLFDPTRFSLPPFPCCEIDLKNVTAAFLPPLAEKVSLVVVNTQKERDTKRLVTRVREIYSQDPDHYSKIFAEIGTFAEKGYRFLVEKQYEAFGDLMNQNQKYLELLQVSSPELERAVQCAKRAGALGAKLTGAGGGGCLVAFHPGHEREIADCCEKEGFPTFIAQIG